jgi:acyl carrier protein
MQISERLTQIFASVTNRQITLEELQGKNVIEVLGLNSVDALEVLIRVEGEFGIQIDDEDLSIDLVQSLQTLTEYVQRRCASETA